MPFVTRPGHEAGGVGLAELFRAGLAEEGVAGSILPCDVAFAAIGRGIHKQ